jgi:uncharacterized protein (TIGR02118 family)
MIRVYVMYPHRDGARFDVAYYAKQHMDMARSAFTEFGLVDIRVDRGLVGSTPKSPPDYVCVGTLTFKSMEDYKRAFRERNAPLMADLPNFTDIQPVVQVSEAVL